ncbi:hypothetical protein J3F84DRAFT_221789 [Trichoderma pleuroticola]
MNQRHLLQGRYKPQSRYNSSKIIILSISLSLPLSYTTKRHGSVSRDSSSPYLHVIPCQHSLPLMHFLLHTRLHIHCYFFSSSHPPDFHPFSWSLRWRS